MRFQESLPRGVFLSLRCRFYVMPFQYIFDCVWNDCCLVISAQLKRCGIKSKLIVNDQDDDLPHQRTVMALQGALQKSLTWHNDLLNGQVSSMVKIAKQEGVTRPYIARHTKLAFLAPDIIETIFQGKIPITLSLDKLKEGFPMDWEAQRKCLDSIPKA